MFLDLSICVQYNSSYEWILTIFEWLGIDEGLSMAQENKKPYKNNLGAGELTDECRIFS